ncbi:MAG TPA: hypothetical protein PK156_24165 [Polyangium sp.]|nr:hypothetical protein [Polyangium sp.]
MTSFQRRAILTCLAALLLGAHEARADEPTRAERDAAKKLYEEAAVELERGDYQSACGKLGEALFLTPGHIRTAISLGACMAKWGKTATAIEHYADARTWARDQNKLDKVAEIDKLIDALAPKLSRLNIIVPPQWAKFEGFTVLRGDKPVPTPDWGDPKVLDPGTYEISATAKGQPKWTTRVELKLGQSVDVTVEPPWTKAGSSRSSGKRGFIGVGLGGAALVAGGVLGGVALSKYNESTRPEYCNAQSQCIRPGYDLRREAQQLGNVSTGLIIGGALLAAGGLTWVLVSREPSKNTTTALIVHPSGIAMSGRW